MERDVIAPKNVSLTAFAMDSLDADSPAMQLHGLRIMHRLLQREPTRTKLFAKLTTSNKTMARIIAMLDWRRPEDTEIRLFAAKIAAELAKSLRVVSIPGTIQSVSALLEDCGNHQQQKKGNRLLDLDDEQEERQDAIVEAGDHKLRQREDQVQEDSHNCLEAQKPSSQQVVINEQYFFSLRCWKWISGFWSIAQEEPLVDHHDDLFPALGMFILDGLAYGHQDNCVEISRAPSLIAKIIDYTIYKNDTKSANEMHQKILLRSSLKLLRRLSSTVGEIGIELRHKIAEHPVLLSNLAEILDDRFSGQEPKTTAAAIIRNLATDTRTSQEIGHIKVIISRLTDAFFSRDNDAPSSTSSDGSLQKAAGQALAVLTMESDDICAAMLMEPVGVIGELTNMICENMHKYVAATLLRNLLLRIQPELSNSDLRELLCSALPKVSHPNSSYKFNYKLELNIIAICSVIFPSKTC